MRGPVLDGSSIVVSAVEKCRDGRIKGALLDVLECSDGTNAAAGVMVEVLAGRKVRRAMAAAARIDCFRVRIDMVLLFMMGLFFVPLTLLFDLYLLSLKVPRDTNLKEYCFTQLY